MTQTEQLRDIVQAVKAVGAVARVLDRDELAARWIGLCEAFGADGRGPNTWLWDAVTDQASRHIPNASDAVAVVSGLVDRRRCLVFFEDYFGAAAGGYNWPGHLHLSCVDVEGEAAVAATLGETSREVYVADPGCSWALMLNHHDDLIGIGDARSWVDALPAR